MAMKSLKNSSWLPRFGIVVVAAVLVELISVVQYRRVRSMLAEEMELRSQTAMQSRVNEIEHVLSLTETTMAENEWDVLRSLSHPDSVFSALARLIDDNPYVVGARVAFVPYFYPSIGRLYEPCARKGKDGSVSFAQIAGPSHDYTVDEDYLWARDSLMAFWTDPILDGPDSLSISTYSKPLFNSKGKMVALCGLDIDLSWLGDTLNAHRRFPSSFGLLLSQEGNLMAGPPEGQVSAEEIHKVVEILNGRLPESAVRGIAIRTAALDKDPYWEVAMVYKTDEVFAGLIKMRRQQFFYLLLALAILAFMINRFARNERKLRDATVEQARIGGELEVARNIQLEMLPKEFPADVYGFLEPAREVGGDLFDFYRRDGKIFFCVGDVSGKGVPAAMLMSMIHSLFRMISQKQESPSHIVRAVNEEICRGNRSNMFVTFFVGCLDFYTGRLRYCNAGHDKPFLLSGSVSLLPVKANLPLGVFPDTDFVEECLQLSADTSLFLYTDGLTEAMDASRCAFGRPRVQEVLEAGLKQALSPREMVESLSRSAHAFVGTAPQSDDLTMLFLRYRPGDLLCKQISLSTHTEEVSRLSDFLKEVCASLELEHKTALGIRLAVEEMVVNVINYAYPENREGTVFVYADSDRSELRFTIVDSGTPFDPTAVIPASTTLDAESRPIGGLGILLARKIMDSVSYCRKENNNVLTLTKSIIEL